MRRRDKTGGKAVKAQRRNAPKAARRRDAAAADLQEQLNRRTSELQEARILL
jgi:hypothetical protein